MMRNSRYFLLSAVLGDGDVEKKRIRLTIGNPKHNLWKDIIERMKAIGFRYDERNERRARIRYKIASSKAVELTRKGLNDPLIKTLIEDLSSLPDAMKLRKLMTLASTRIKPKGSSSVEVINGVQMSIRVTRNGYIELVINRSMLEDAKAVQEALQKADYDAKLSQRGKKFVVFINKDEIVRHPVLVVKVCEVLRRMLNETMNEGKIERARSVTKAMINLNCPAQGPRAQ
ncbi:hypothetical protein [Vulcanisaeta distributa]|uniref:Uncharacterized protein n=1 Tax=Vulcanisaeta distributa (strain DSM 14429 / JCM 11212 / NBRC 100878 / IC-017) TaxID=572478 RepID=E1QNC4_VULDI|nr:hypothetical protein [Vulcanisaeta distributa]ADN50094.1 hypothetical protein Vdis_0701 [Vulcanisaeta distributa DSM 14429]